MHTFYRNLRFPMLCWLVLSTAISAHPILHAQDGKPLTEDQLTQASNGPLRSYPEGLKGLINEHGLDFLPTNSFLTKLALSESVKQTILYKAGSQMRIRVCQFTGDDQPLAKRFAEQMGQQLINAKKGNIPPFGYIPLDDDIRLPDKCGQVDASSNAIYILLEGRITKTPSGFSLWLQVASLNSSGEKHPLKDAEGTPQGFTQETLSDTARQVVNWGIETVQQYAQK